MTNIEKASKGLRWRKVDLHVHTPASHDWTGDDISPDEFVAQILAKGINAIAVTDHNSGEWVDQLMTAARPTALTVFPGVEISATGGEHGIHVIAIFDTTSTTKTIENLLAKVGLEAADYGKADAISKFGPEAVVDAIHHCGGLAILAHADSSRGVLSDMRGAQRTNVMNSPSLAAVELTNVTKSATYCSGNEPNYRRKLAYYRSSDNPSAVEGHGHSIEGVGKRYSWFKSDGLSLEALRQVFNDPHQRIRCDEESAEIPDQMYPRVLSLRVSAGFLKGTTFEFHEALNTIIGGKGVGKSLLVEFLRFALDQSSGIPTILEDMNGKLQRQLGLGGQVMVRVQLAADQTMNVNRTYNGLDNPIEVTYASGGEVAGDIRQLFPLLAYSQTETIEIARNDEAQLALIDSFLDLSPIETRIAQIEEKLTVSDREMTAAIEAQELLEQAKRDLASSNARIAIIEKVLESKELDALQALKPMSSFMQSVTLFAEDVSEAVKGTAAALKGCAAPTPEGVLRDDTTVTQLADRLREDAQSLTASARALEDDAQRLAKRALAAVEAWDRQYAAAEKKYADFVKKQGGDRIQLLAQKTNLERSRKEQTTRVQGLEKRWTSLPNLRIARAKLLKDLDSEADKRRTLRRDKYAELSNASNSRLDLQLVNGGQRGKYVEFVKSLKRGSKLQDSTIEQICTNVEPRKLVDLIESRDAQALQTMSGIRAESAKTFVDFFGSIGDATAILALQHGSLLEDRPQIRFRKEDGKHYDLRELSVGQRCTALLIIALADGTRPIVIDQPEDALDITSIYEDVTLQLRERKHARQFIVTTHNPTVAVAGDSDAFHVLKASASHGQVSIVGGIDQESVRQAVIQHLEGGAEPLTMKSRKYGVNL